MWSIGITEMVSRKTDGIMKLMQHHHHSVITDSFHCKRSESGEVVHVYNSNNYLMAEYTVRTGRISWQRVAALTQRESVEKWLRNNYPVVSTAKPVVVNKLSARAVRQ
jgi:hypothetical protein